MTAFTAFLQSLEPRRGAAGAALLRRPHARAVRLRAARGGLRRRRCPRSRAASCCRRPTGVLNVETAWPAIKTLREPVFYLSGPPQMLAALTTQLARARRRRRRHPHRCVGVAPKPLPSADLEHVLRLTGGIWEGFRGARLGLTGGSGFFGRWMLQSFLLANDEHGLGARVILLSIRDASRLAVSAPYLAEHRSVEIVTGDVHTLSGARMTRMSCIWLRRPLIRREACRPGRRLRPASSAPWKCLIWLGAAVSSGSADELGRRLWPAACGTSQGG